MKRLTERKVRRALAALDALVECADLDKADRLAHAAIVEVYVDRIEPLLQQFDPGLG